MGGGAWKAIVHEVTKSWTRLSDFTFLTFFHTRGGGLTHSIIIAQIIMQETQW